MIHFLYLAVQAPGRSSRPENSEESDDCHTDPGGRQGDLLQHRNQEPLNARRNRLIPLTITVTAT